MRTHCSGCSCCRDFNATRCSSRLTGDKLPVSTGILLDSAGWASSSYVLMLDLLETSIATLTPTVIVQLMGWSGLRVCWRRTISLGLELGSGGVPPNPFVVSTNLGLNQQRHARDSSGGQPVYNCLLEFNAATASLDGAAGLMPRMGVDAPNWRQQSPGCTLYMYICICMFLYIYIHTHIHITREHITREREKDRERESASERERETDLPCNRVWLARYKVSRCCLWRIPLARGDGWGFASGTGGRHSTNASLAMGLGQSCIAQCFVTLLGPVAFPGFNKCCFMQATSEGSHERMVPGKRCQ